MARKIINRKEQRVVAEAAERKAATAAADGKGEEAPAKKVVKRKSRAKTPKEIRLKAFWGVFNQSLKRVALFEYAERTKADKKAAEMSTTHKTPHFVHPVKETITE